MALDSRLTNWEGCGCLWTPGAASPKTQKGHGRGEKWLRPKEGPAQPRSLQWPFHNPWETNRDDLLTGLFWDPLSIPGTLRIPRIPSPATAPSALGAGVWLLPCTALEPPRSPHAVVTELSGLRLEFHPLTPPSPWKTGRFGGAPAPKNPSGHTLRPCRGGQKKAPGWEVFPSCSLRSQIPSATAPIPPAPGLADPTAGRTRCPRRVWGVP